MPVQTATTHAAQQPHDQELVSADGGRVDVHVDTVDTGGGVEQADSAGALVYSVSDAAAGGDAGTGGAR